MDLPQAEHHTGTAEEEEERPKPQSPRAMKIKLNSEFARHLTSHLPFFLQLSYGNLLRSKCSGQVD